MVNEIGVGTSHKTFYSREFFNRLLDFFIKKTSHYERKNYVYIQNACMWKVVQEMQSGSVALICRCVDVWIENWILSIIVSDI